MPFRVTSAPASEPVTTAEAKEHLRLETALDDVYVASLIVAARRHVEQVCRRGLVTQSVELMVPKFPETCYQLYDGVTLPQQETLKGTLELPFGQLASVTSVKYIDPLGAE